jgi:hypothetical protein
MKRKRLCRIFAILRLVLFILVKFFALWIEMLVGKFTDPGSRRVWTYGSGTTRYACTWTTTAAGP